MIKKRLLKYPGFIYRVGTKYYYLGKWICKECTGTDESDCVMMYEMCRQAGEENEAGMYFHKIRAYSDFALEIPYNPAQIEADITVLIENMQDTELESLSLQLKHFEEDHGTYCGELPKVEA